MRIYVDIDDILCETAASLCELAATEFGRHVPYAEVREFNLQRVFDLSDAEMRRFYTRSHEYAMLMGYPPTPGAAAGVCALRSAGADVNLLTGRPAATARGTEDWLAANGLGDFSVEYVDKYGRFHGAQRGEPPTLTLEELLARHYDFAIDDSPVILKRLAAWHTTTVLVFDRPWNRDYPLAANMRRVQSWADIVAAVRNGR